MRKINIILLAAVFAGSNLTAQKPVSSNETATGKKEAFSIFSGDITNLKEAEKSVAQSAMPSVSLKAADSVTGISQKDGKIIRTIPDRKQKDWNSANNVQQQNVASGKNYKTICTVIKSKNDDVATIKLIVDGYPPYPAGSGFQLIVDEDHILFDNFYSGVYDGNVQQSYDDCEYKIPENACADLGEPNVLVNATASIEVPEGIYDFVILAPVPAYQITFICSLEINDNYFEAFFDDYEFFAGYEYIFRHQQWANFGFEADHDAQLSDLILPEMSTNLSNQEAITVVLYNNGKHDLSNVELSYRINGGEPVVETFTETLEPGEQTLYTFNGKADFSTDGLYKVEANLNYYMDMIPMNNSSLNYTRKKGPIALPFFENFDHYRRLELNWTIIDVNNDELAWHYDDVNWDMGDEYGMVQVGAPWDDIYYCDDYLISDALIFPTAGTYHISFNAFIFNNESFKILYGTSSNPEEMKLLIDYPIEKLNYEFKSYAVNFEIETPGNYYFAFYYYSHPNNGGVALDIDDILIAQGVVQGGTPDVTVYEILTPVSGCGLAESVIGAVVYNAGTANLDKFSLTYQIPGIGTVTQSFNKTIEPSRSEIVYFEETADFSSIGDYYITISATTPDEENFSNNSMSKMLRHYDKITELPFKCNFLNEEDRKNWMPTGINGWAVNPNPQWGCYYAETNYNDIPLLSRCITLQPDVYRFSYTYLAGWNGTTDNFYVTYGKSGTDPYTWEPIKTYHDCYTDAEKIEDFILLDITEAGEYAFAFFTIGSTINFAIFTTSVEDGVQEHDFRIKDVVFPTALAPRFTPIFHASNEHIITAVVENRGKTAFESGKIDLSVNNVKITSKDFNFTKLGEVKDIDLEVDFTKISSGIMSLYFYALLESGIEYTYERSKIVSDSTFVKDYIDTNFGDFGIGVNNYGPVGFGMVFELTKRDILTSIDLGFAEMENTLNIGIAVYPFTENVYPGNPIFVVEYPRTFGNNEKALTFDVPDIELVPGKYLFEARQLTTQNYAIASDKTPDGFFYLNTLDGSISKYTGLGNVHIRPNFGNPPVKIMPNQVLDSQFVLYPNPAKEAVTVMRSSADKARIEIYNVNGSLVKIYEINETKCEINVSSLPAGIYMIKLIDNNQVSTQKLVKSEL